ncbi:NADH dehydrogenase 1 alpha subcomplex subunit 2 [Trichonephila clavipes]|nr:NADH dehydrogenase 1 alpha subcomplex subunit 2 [Trichonephila clavipes]
MRVYYPILSTQDSAEIFTGEFIRKHYVPIKKQNPAFPILIRECEGIEPRIYARYDFGKETSVSLSNNKSDEVLEIVRKLTNTSSK